MSQPSDIFTPEELKQFDLDRRRLLAHAYVASGVPTSPRHEQMLNQIITPAQGGESSQPRPQLAQYNDGNELHRQGSIRGTTKLAVEAKVKICSPTFKCWIEATAKFDTGTREDWMSKHLVEKLGLLPEPGPIILYETFSGETLQSDLIIKKVTWGSVGSDNRTWVGEFRLAPEKAPFEVLFGSDFISSEKIYTFNEATLILTRKQDTTGKLTYIALAIEEDKRTREEKEAEVEAEAEALEKERQSSTARQTNFVAADQSAKDRAEEEGKQRAGGSSSS